MGRRTGILISISVPPGNQGIGGFGTHTYRLIDTISRQHIRIWQILPLNPVGCGNSPYQPFLSYTEDEVYISVDTLADYGLFKQGPICNCNKLPEKVDYDEVHAFKAPHLKEAYKTSLEIRDTFAWKHQLSCSTTPQLYPYAVFVALEKHNQMASWTQWPKEQRKWIRDRRFSLKEFGEEIRCEQSLQFIFYRQWNQVEAYANAHGVEIMGDLPFYIGLDGADVWQNQEDFLLDSQGNPNHITGVPPGYFSNDGQRWGNPIYDWKRMKRDHYDF